MKFNGPNNEFLQLQTFNGNETLFFDKELNYPLLFVWIRNPDSQLYFEGNRLDLPPNTVICLTEFHRIDFVNVREASLIKFNREFYCVLDHDKEVSCRGILFYGSDKIPYFRIPDEVLEQFENLWKMFQVEIQTKDDMQLDMLQTMLKRFIILCTRVYKNLNNLSPLQPVEVDIIRDFNFYVEQHFRTKHSVQDYADILFKSPKTLSNVFAKFSARTPLQVIHERIVLEARRMLRYTDKSVKEISYDLGFEDIQTFSRFFKKMSGISPSDFKNQFLGKIDNSQGIMT
ncbi:AraC family transcriptional regulator [Flavobacterium cyanobacteriorum]|uniref:AraC family transcriptional regulator n=1 Tax=Flavobacterium cyanobacteriorum TaxID=2022802 RepID=A0A255Z0A5_9FLAO|nr:helix-turn-helix domain-containing protein [Flavobacterium cyanobacteriorum]OYQ34090.1 AraC family transcriptional regulator [Flavobacterium cyanobacteriorum]